MIRDLGTRKRLIAAVAILSVAAPTAATDCEVVVFEVPTAPITGAVNYKAIEYVLANARWANGDTQK
jgi:hypothetical protein